MEALGVAILSALSALLAPQQEATLLFAGDAMMHQRQIDAARRTDGTYDYSGYFTHVAPLVTEADYAVVNLETPLAGGRYSGFPMFNTADSYADALADAGFDMMLTANNHTLDRRDAGLRRTACILDDKGIDHIGTYRSAAARDSVMPFIKDINGFNIAFLNYTYGTNGIDIQTDVVVDYIDRSRMAADISEARSHGAEMVCVAVHWGDEYKLLPNHHQKSLADFLVEQGVELVIGGHPHVIQPMEMREGADGKRHLVVYSLGNFISGMLTRDTRGGAVVRAHLRRDDQGRPYVEAADYDLVFTVPDSPSYHLEFADSCRNPRWAPACRAFRESAMAIFDRHNVHVPKRKYSEFPNNQ